MSGLYNLKLFLSFKLMSDSIINRHIADDEILVRFLFTNDLKKSSKPVTFSNIDIAEVFFDQRGGVSLTRYINNSEEDCIKRASQNSLKCIGFAIFKKTQFDQSVLENRTTRPSFYCEIIGTPLDENNEYIPEDIDVYLYAKGHPGHADIYYINPGVSATNETANTAIRVFSRLHFKNSQIVLLDENMTVEQGYFSSLFNKI